MVAFSRNAAANFARRSYHPRRFNMLKSVKEKMVGAGQLLVDTTKKEIEIAKVKPHMAVIASCGEQIGIVDQLEGKSIKLTRVNSPDGQHHFIPSDWIHRVDSQVHLKKDALDTVFGWKWDAASCE
jgi:hypothetical protein